MQIQLTTVLQIRAREPTFKNLHFELPELEKSVKYISLTVLSEKEVI